MCLTQSQGLAMASLRYAYHFAVIMNLEKRLEIPNRNFIHIELWSLL
jgi:hypothetical protein